MVKARGLALLLLMLLLGLAAAQAQQAPEPADRPRGGLFSEEGAIDRPLSMTWFVLGIYVLAGLIFAGACAHLAVHKALPPIRWFFAGFFLNAVGYLILLMRPAGDPHSYPAGVPRGLRKVPRTYSSDECSECSYPNHPAAYCCLGCGAEVHPQFESEAARWRKQHRPR